MDSSLSQIQSALNSLRQELAHRILGQDQMIEHLLLVLLAGGHALIEGVPGLGKTRTIQTMAGLLGLPFHRVSFTPDLLPSDLIGGEVYRPAKGDFFIRKGPLFTSILLADEINRTPPKVQSALLEAMEEHRVTISETTFELSDPFFVFATMNPIEQAGTYPLPEAQLDRFLVKIILDYPTMHDEIEIFRRESKASTPPISVTPAIPIPLFREQIQDRVRVDEQILHYISHILEATRYPHGVYQEIAPLISYGASTRAGLALIRLARVRAVLMGRDFVLPEDIKSLAHITLRHRIGLSYEAIASGKGADAIIDFILDHTIVP